MSDKRYKEEITRFRAADEEGNEITVICVRTITLSRTLDGKEARVRGLKEYMTTSGEPVTPIDSETFKVVTTDQIIRRIA
jgi:hypothetical protein